MNTFKITIATLGLSLLGAMSAASAQSGHQNELRSTENLPARAAGLERGEKRKGRPLDFAIMLEDDQTKFGGLQFQIHYDEGIEAVSVNSCLGGIPETHIGAFTSCDVLADRNEVRVVITDLGKNRLIPPGLLGVIRLQADGRDLSPGDVSVKEFQALDTKGNSILRPNGGKFIQIRQIQ